MPSKPPSTRSSLLSLLSRGYSIAAHAEARFLSFYDPRTKPIEHLGLEYVQLLVPMAAVEK